MFQQNNCFQKNLFSIGLWVILILIIVILVEGYFIPQESNIKTYLNNQTVSVFIGFLGLFIGYRVWLQQHKKELADQYYAEYLKSVYKYFSIKKEEIDLRKEKNKRYHALKDKNKDWQSDSVMIEIDRRLSDLNRDEIQNTGLIKSYIFLLRQFNDERWQKIEEMQRKFGKEFKENFSKKTVTGKGAFFTKSYEEAVSCINSYLDKALDDLSKLA